MSDMLDAPNKAVKHKEQKVRHTLKMSLQDRINELFAMDRPEAKNAELARYCHVSRGAVTDWRNGQTQTINGDNAHNVARFFGVNSEWVQNGKRPKYIKNVTGVKNVENSLSLPGLPDNYKALELFRFPLLVLNRAGGWQEALKNHHPADGEIMIVDQITGVDLFAVEVRDDEMDGENGFRKGDHVIIDPHAEPKHEDIILVESGGRVLLRQLWNDGAEWMLNPINTRYLPRPKGGSVIIGVVRYWAPKGRAYT